MSTPSSPRRVRLTAFVGAIAAIVVVLFTIRWTLSPQATSVPLEGRFAGNAVLAFEYARTVDDVEAVIGSVDAPTPGDLAIRADLDALNHADYGYMLAYGALLLCGLRLSPPLQTRRRLADALTTILVFAVVADALENLALLQLTAAWRADDVETWLPLLMGAATTKWTLLAVVNLGLATAAWWRQSLRWRAAAVLGALAVPNAIAAIVWPATTAALLVVCFAPMWIGCVVDVVAAARRTGDAVA